MMTTKERAYLKSLASTLTPILQIGKSGLSPEVRDAVEEIFNTHELIKLSVLKNCAEDPTALAHMLADRTHSQVVQVIGKKIVLYRQDNDKPKIVLPKSR